MNGVLIVRMRNNVKRASKKRLQQLIDEQKARDTTSMKGQIHEEIVRKVPGKDPYIFSTYLHQKVLFVSHWRTKIP